MIMKFILKLLKYLFIFIVLIIVLFLGTIYSFKFYQWRKYPEVISIDVIDTINECEEGCRDYIVKFVDSKSFNWLTGKTVNIRQYSHEHTNGMPQEWYDAGYKVWCITGRLHKAKDHWFWFYPRDVYNFTGSAVHPGMCSNPKAKRFER